MALLIVSIYFAKDTAHQSRVKAPLTNATIISTIYYIDSCQKRQAPRGKVFWGAGGRSPGEGGPFDLPSCLRHTLKSMDDHRVGVLVPRHARCTLRKVCASCSVVVAGSPNLCWLALAITLIRQSPDSIVHHLHSRFPSEAIQFEWSPCFFRRNAILNFNSEFIFQCATVIGAKSSVLCHARAFSSFALQIWQPLKITRWYSIVSSKHPVVAGPWSLEPFIQAATPPLVIISHAPYLTPTRKPYEYNACSCGDRCFV